MHLGSPLSLVGLLLALPLIALFFLRIRPRRVEVATARMWNALLPQSRPRQWWSKLRHPLFLLLQLALLGLLVMSLAEPQYVDPAHPPVTRVLLLDNWASMHARRGRVSLWDEEKSASGRVIEHQPPGHPTDRREHTDQARAHAFGVLAGQRHAKAHVRIRERDHQHVHVTLHARDQRPS